ncbi:Mur ligase family protein [uncultured Cardiobacterium sp.]|uniref:bifunctional folylpolyglutamate synthase/dihydrofolate synthase n=1 Tax=uncultured Cardiobacterium sp. TaxID=417619 RepID=UPI0026063973|nr:Mur ligase family protein [uncultured Cardiobacterium sp.]
MKRTLSEWLAWQETAHDKAWDPGLERAAAVWQALGAPRLAAHTITVAGTNGKGSCVCWLEAICRAHGVSVASFTSPHLHDYRERIRFDGAWVAVDALAAAFDTIDAARGDISLSYFEWSALAALWLIAQRQPAVAVLEVGLGGRLDATNIIDADAAIITRIGLDHQEWLGHDIPAIAAEKAGILRPGQRVYLPDAHPPAVLYERAAALGATTNSYGQELRATAEADGLHISVPGYHDTLPYPTHMHGAHQYGHLAAAIAALAPWLALDTAKLAAACESAQNPARLSLIDGEPRWLYDVAHNADSAEILARYLHDLPRRGGRIIALCSILRDKDQRAIYRHLAPEIDEWVLAPLPGARGSDIGTLTAHAVAAGIARKNIHPCDDIPAACRLARTLAAPLDTIAVFGSFVTVAAVQKGQQP